MIDIIARCRSEPPLPARDLAIAVPARPSYFRNRHTPPSFRPDSGAMGFRPSLLRSRLPIRLVASACLAQLSHLRTVQMRSVASSLRTRLAPTPAFRPSCRPSLFARGKKTTTLAAKDLPQGLIGGPPLEDLGEDAGPAYPTLLQQVRNNMRKFDHCVLLTRVGNFYEVCLETECRCGILTGKIDDLNKYVAISDEVRNDPSSKLKSGGLLFDRKVSRIITPGTLVDEKFIDPWENNYCLAIHVVPAGASDYASDKVDAQSADIGLAWLDMSSGEFSTQSTTITGLSSALALIRPREVVLHSALEELADSRLVNILEEDRHVITFHQPEPGSNVPDKHGQVLQNAVPGCNPSAFPLPELGAAAFLLEYVRAQLQGSSIALQPPVRREATEFMSIDKNTLRALELRTTLREGKLEGSLLHSIRKTVTKSGTRLLTQRLTSPSMSLDIINERLDLVAGLIENVALRQNLVALLRRTFDTWRLVQKFSIGRGDADDLLELSKTIQITKDVAQLLENETGCKASFEGLVRRLSLDGPGRLSKRILDAIDEDGLSEQHRIEDDEAAAMAGLAAEVLTEEGEEVKSGNLAKLSKAKQNGRLGGSKAVDTGLPDVWIMRCR
ncbi:DNA mismatch repair protein MutS core [Macrophomina phaseolina MS6]|uniref:DNA mismatch repair protein MutS core n=1 Tax=Macrophomina phaseolina (strain MS6) TaxID=1126212 RepID=K2S4Y0_MACPH|nr:DNA mismatch repair protein MutS core [Macrophomina phaseolina MS6]